MRRFTLVLISPSHYDDEGYVIQWLRSAMPSNSLATLHGLACDCAERRVLGEDVELKSVLVDEANTRVRVRRLVRHIRRDGGTGLVGLVGVQTNQFPRALDLARRFRQHRIPVCIGGFHVSGSIAMMERLTPELAEAQELGISLFAGEAENRLETVLKDAFAGALKPLYNYLGDPPELDAAPQPRLLRSHVQRTGGAQASFDAGRGCPFACSFCTIINVQGHRSRSRSPDDVEQIVRFHTGQGVRRFLITDDNFARNRRWEEILDRLIMLHEEGGLVFNVALQVDTQCHKIPRFIEKAARAKVKRVFIGLENIRPASLVHANKRQNSIPEYREMLLAWRAAGVCTVGGYILGFPADTPSSIIEDVETIKRELPIDLLEFLCLTPLPGSREHLERLHDGTGMDEDLNRYDLAHVTTNHATMTRTQWERAYRQAWDTYYTDEHIARLLRRARACGITLGKILGAAVWYYGSVAFEGVDPMDAGLLRRKVRTDRRPGLPRESPLRFYPRYWWELVVSNAQVLRLFLRHHRLRRQIDNDPTGGHYRDSSLAGMGETGRA